MTDAATDQGNGNIVEDDCPLCLEPMPPFWELERRSTLVCCGKDICGDCWNERTAFLLRAAQNGSFGREEQQLASCCPLCRTRKPADNNFGKMMIEKFEKGHLTLNLYNKMGMQFIDGMEGVEKNVERGTEIWQLGANKGYPNCQFFLGVYSAEGRDGYPKSTAEAKRWYLAAVEQGHAKAEYCLALLLRDDGKSAESLQCLRGSASKGFDEAICSLGRAHVSGAYGLQKSTEDAIRVVTPAAERGHAESMWLLGRIMCQPDPYVPPPDNPKFTEGMHWLRRLAEKGEEKAISNLGSFEKMVSSICFMCGEGAPPPEKACLRCSRCRAAWYCSKDCQVQHWKAEGGHKHFCIKWE